MRIVKKKIIADPDAIVDPFSSFFSSCAYIGHIPFASGTFGSIFALVFFMIDGFYQTEILLPAIAVCFVLGIITSGNMIKRYGDDPSVVVIDEVAGMWITILVFKLLSGMKLLFPFIIICFLSFRFFDIIKLQPAKYFDKMNSGLGIMMDDVISGIYAGITSYLILIMIRVLFAFTIFN